MTGTIANSLFVIIGALLGLMINKNIPERFQTTIMQGIGMIIGIIGLQMALKSTNILIILISITLGGLIGEYLRLDVALKKLGDKLSSVVSNILPKTKGPEDSFSEAFVTSTLLFCVGAMAIVGSIEEGLTGNANILITKAFIDGIVAVFLASSLGVGVAFSAIPIFLYQGLITILGIYFGNFISDIIVNEIVTTGGILIVGISLSMLKICDIKLANLLPSILVVIVIMVAYVNFI